MSHTSRPTMVCALFLFTFSTTALGQLAQEQPTPRQPVQYAPLKPGVVLPDDGGGWLDDRPSGQGLRGLRKLRLGIARNFSKLGFDMTQLRADIEKLLDAGGIEIISGDPPSNTRDATLLLNVSEIREIENGHGVAVRTRVLEDVIVARDPSLTVRAAIWEAGPDVTWAGRPAGGHLSVIREAVLITINRLVRDYSKANK